MDQRQAVGGEHRGVSENLRRIGEGTPWSAPGNRSEPYLPRDPARATHNRDLTAVGRPRWFPQKWIGAVRLEHDPGAATIGPRNGQLHLSGRPPPEKNDPPTA